MIRLWRTIGDRRTKRIAFYALTRACGTTHVAVAAANYLASREKRKVLYLEAPSEEDTSCGVIRFRTKKVLAAGGLSGFEREGVVYIPSCEPEDVRRLLAEGFDYILAELPGWKRECALLSDMFEKRIFTFSAKPWRYADMQATLKQFISLRTDTPQGEYCSFGLTASEERMAAADFKLRCKEIPFIRDPFHLKKEDLSFLKQLLSNRL